MVAAYTSPERNLRELLSGFVRERYTVTAASWTLYWPRHNRGVATGSYVIPDSIVDNIQGVQMNVTDRLDPVLGVVDPIALDVGVTRGATSNWQHSPADPWAATLSDRAAMPSYAGGSRLDGNVEVAKADSFHFRLYFNLNTDTLTPLYESPVLDDVTFFLVPNRPEILQWYVLP